VVNRVFEPFQRRRFIGAAHQAGGDIARIGKVDLDQGIVAFVELV
jgi:hypothetical protein